MVDNEELKFCCERLQKVLESIKKNRDEIGRIHSELDDNVRELIEIMPTFLAQNSDGNSQNNICITDLIKEIQLLSKKIDLFQSSSKGRTDSSIQGLSTQNVIKEDSNNEKEGFQKVNIERTQFKEPTQTNSNITITPHSDQAIIEKYRNEISEFVNEYNMQPFAGSNDIKLIVSPEDKKRLSKNNLESWNDIKDVEKICLIETSGIYSYQAKPLNINVDGGGQFFLVAPNKLTTIFNKKTVVEDAYLAFFYFKNNNGFSERGNKGKLIKPATFQKIDSFYKLISKGEIEI